MEVSASAAVLPLTPDQRVFAPGCATRVLLDHITGKWGVLLLVALTDGPRRWSALRRRAQGISEKMLAQTLKTLERDGLVHREAQPVIPPRVDYSLTERGQELTALLVPLVDWVATHADGVSTGGAEGGVSGGRAEGA